MDDTDITPFYRHLVNYTVHYIARFLLYMALVGLGAWLAFCYLSDAKEGESDGDSGQDD